MNTLISFDKEIEVITHMTLNNLLDRKMNVESLPIFECLVPEKISLNFELEVSSSLKGVLIHK